MKTISVDIKQLEEAFGFDLHKFEPGKTYPLSKLMEALGFMKPGRPRDTRRGDKN